MRLLTLAGAFVGACSLFAASVDAGQDKGYDAYGYNYGARIFNGDADGVDRIDDGKLWGDPTYAADHLVMKWSKAWDDAKFNGKPWGPDAWTTNEWNGMGPDGTQETAHYKIVWVGPELESSVYWRDGGYAVWGEFEVIDDHGKTPDGHFRYAHAVPNGLGSK